MSRMSHDDIERHLEQLPREAWERPAPPPPPWAEAQHGRRRRGVLLRPLPAIALSVALLAVGVGVGLLLGGDQDSAEPGETPVTAQLEPVGKRGAGASGSVRLEPRAGGRATVELTGLRPSSGQDFYELWLLGDDGRLVSLGALRVPESGSATAEVELPVDPARFSFIDVSREPADGNPAHSSISVLRGPAT